MSGLKFHFHLNHKRKDLSGGVSPVQTSDEGCYNMRSESMWQFSGQPRSYMLCAPNTNGIIYVAVVILHVWVVDTDYTSAYYVCLCHVCVQSFSHYTCYAVCIGHTAWKAETAISLPVLQHTYVNSE